MVDVGQAAPDFTLPSQDSAEVTLSAFKGDKAVVLSFHIFSFTGGWTGQVSSFRVANPLFEEKNAQVLGISCDSRPSQTAYSASLGGIPYPLLSDFHPKGAVTQAYGIYNEERGAPNRAVFIVDAEGIVRFKRVYDNAIDLDPKDILAELDKI